MTLIVQSVCLFTLFDLNSLFILFLYIVLSWLLFTLFALKCIFLLCDLIVCLHLLFVYIVYNRLFALFDFECYIYMKWPWIPETWFIYLFLYLKKKWFKMWKFVLIDKKIGSSSKNLQRKQEPTIVTYEHLFATIDKT